MTSAIRRAHAAEGASKENGMPTIKFEKIKLIFIRTTSMIIALSHKLQMMNTVKCMQPSTSGSVKESLKGKTQNEVCIYNPPHPPHSMHALVWHV